MGDGRRTLDVLDTELLDEAGREDTRGERSSEDRRELGVESSDTHVLELEIRGQDRIRRSPTSNSSVPVAVLSLTNGLTSSQTT